MTKGQALNEVTIHSAADIRRTFQFCSHIHRRESCSVIAAQAPPPTRGKTRGRPGGKKQAEPLRGRGRGRPPGRGNGRGNGRGLRRGYSLTHSPEIVTAVPPSLPHSPAEIDNTYVRR